MTATLPAVRAGLHGRVLDVDTHEMIPAHLWGDTFGPAGARLRRLMEGTIADAGDTNVAAAVETDEMPLDETTVWTAKGPSAPGAIDMRRRLGVMDAMGVRRQLIFPFFGVIAFTLWSSDDRVVEQIFGMSAAEWRDGDLVGAVIEAHNEWVLHTAAIDQRRLRPVALLLSESLDAMVAGAGDLIDRGARAIWIPSGRPPAGMSPADPRLDPFWSLAAEAGVPVILHTGTSLSFSASPLWREAPAFVPDPASFAQAEFVLEPFTASTMHMGEENFLAAMILGGVFERHPSLRVGVIECGASWVGPLADRLDMWHEVFAASRHLLGSRPSEYMQRNVRVTPYWMEPVDRFIERYGLEDVYCYSSDYPHVEGGRNSLARFVDRVAPLGDAVTEKFFVTNAELILPE